MSITFVDVMNAIVVYATHRGNTEKVAHAIASATNCKAVKLPENFDAQTLPLNSYNLVFLGTGIRGGEPYLELLNYLRTVTLKAEGTRFVLFMTWAGGGASNKLAYEGVKHALEARDQRLCEDYFICLVQTFGFTRRGRQNAGDLAQARKWATDQQSLPSQ
jgi:flavodoxin